MATLDKSLDDIISAKTKGRRGRRGPRGSGTASPAIAPSSKDARGRYAGAVPAANGNRVVSAPLQTAVQGDATKIIVSNLPFDVSEIQIKELFATTVGPTREVTLHYDQKGASKGLAAVTFSKRGDANKAFTSYNNRLIDGKRPMKIEIVVDPGRPQPVSLSQRVAPAPAPVATPINGIGADAVVQNAARNRNSRRGRGNGRGKGTQRPNKSVADLDAEMEDYTNTPAA